MQNTKNTNALSYHHQNGIPGKLSVQPTKPLNTPEDLSLAYSPGVAAPVEAIDANPDDVYKYTNKGNLVGVITNGTAILGLGDRGALASKPVMEGKAVLFKKFAQVDAFDIEMDCKNIEQIISTIKNIAPTFGGINLEDIKAPECFEIEERLVEELDIPVFHDDQHGTAIVVGAALLNALELTNKKINQVKIVVNGAGAAGVAICKFLVELGATKQNIVLCDSKGIIYQGRAEGMNMYKEEFAVETSDRLLDNAINNSDVFIGISVANVVTEQMISSMNNNPIVFALSNPNPEIAYELAMRVRPDCIMATGRSDYPNQVNNVLCFPYIFRGALDARAKKITPAMKRACAQALADVAKQPVPQEVLDIYKLNHLEFGPDYILPKPFDPRLLDKVAGAVRDVA